MESVCEHTLVTCYDWFTFIADSVCKHILVECYSADMGLFRVCVYISTVPVAASDVLL